MNKNQIETRVAQEVRALMANIEVDCSIEKLEQDRTTLMDQLKEFKINSSSNEEELGTITESIELRNVQIADLRQKILESRQENRANVSWKAIHAVADAQIAFEMALEIVTQDRRQQCRKFNDLKGKKCQNLQAQLEEYQKRESESKTSTSQDTPNTSNAETTTKSNEHSQTQLENRVTMLQKDLENAIEAGLELERILREVLSSDNEVNPLAESMEDLQARLDAQQATNALDLKTQENIRRDSQFIAIINKLEKGLLMSLKACEALNENLKSTKEKNVKTELEDQVTMLEKGLENATVAGLELERMLGEVLSSDNEVNPLAQSMEDLQALLDAQQARSALNLKTQELVTRSFSDIQGDEATCVEQE